MPGKRPRAKPEKLTYTRVHLKGTAAKDVELPSPGLDVLVRVPADEQEGLGGVQAQVAQVRAVDQTTRKIRVHYYGWGEQYGSPHKGTGDGMCSASDLLGWREGSAGFERHREEAASHAKAIREIHAAGEYEIPEDDSNYVQRKMKSVRGVAQVTDRCIRQTSKGSKFEVCWHLKYEDRHQQNDGWVAAADCEVVTAPEKLSENGGVVRIQLSERRPGSGEWLTLMREGKGASCTVWAAQDDFLAFAAPSFRPGSTFRYDPALASKIKDKPFGRGLEHRKAIPFSRVFFETFARALPRDHIRDYLYTQREAGSTDEDWLLQQVADRLADASIAAPRVPPIKLRPRVDAARYSSEEYSVAVRVAIRQGKQPLLAGVDLLALCTGRKKTANSAAVFTTALRGFNAPFDFSLGAGKEKEPAVCADLLDDFLDAAIETLEDDATGRRAALADFRGASRCGWLRDVIRDLTECSRDLRGQSPPMSRPPKLQSGPAAADQEGDEEDESDEDEDEEVEDEQRPAPTVVSWEKQEPRPAPYLKRPEWEADAERLLKQHRKKPSDTKKLRAGEFDYVKAVTKGVLTAAEQEEVRGQIEKILTAPKVAARVSIGEINDPEHPARRGATNNGYDKPVYGGFAARPMQMNTVLGEYTGRVVPSGVAEQEEEQMLDELVESYSSVDAASTVSRGENFSKYSYDTDDKSLFSNWKERDTLVLDTAEGANELSLLNDFREDVAGGEEAAEAQKKRGKGPNVGTIQVVDKFSGKPHILFITLRDVAAKEELTIDYGEQFWTSYLDRTRWIGRLRRSQEALDKEKQARVTAERTEKKAADALVKEQQARAAAQTQAQEAQALHEQEKAGRLAAEKRVQELEQQLAQPAKRKRGPAQPWTVGEEQKLYDLMATEDGKNMSWKERADALGTRDRGESVSQRWKLIELGGLLTSPTLGLGESLPLDAPVARTKQGVPSLKPPTKKAKVPAASDKPASAADALSPAVSPPQSQSPSSGQRPRAGAESLSPSQMLSSVADAASSETVKKVNDITASVGLHFRRWSWSSTQPDPKASQEGDPGSESESEEADDTAPRRRSSSGAAARRAPFKVGDAVQAFNGAAGPYPATVREVEQDGSFYLLDWADNDPNKRRQPAENVLAPAVHRNFRDTASVSFQQPRGAACSAASKGRSKGPLSSSSKPDPQSWTDLVKRCAHDKSNLSVYVNARCVAMQLTMLEPQVIVTFASIANRY